MAQLQKPSDITPTVCVFPDCIESVTDRFDLPLCDRHILKVYRAVQSLMDVAAVDPPADPDDVSGTG